MRHHPVFAIRIWSLSLLLANVIAFETPSYAGQYADNLSECLVRSSTEADRITLVRYFFAVISLHPDIESLEIVTESKREELAKAMAALFDRLLTESCRRETQEAVRLEGLQALGPPFRNFGELAARELLADPRVAKGALGFTKYMNVKKLEELREEPK